MIGTNINYFLVFNLSLNNINTNNFILELFPLKKRCSNGKNYLMEKFVLDVTRTSTFHYKINKPENDCFFCIKESLGT
jgi:hypothetical protein